MNNNPKKNSNMNTPISKTISNWSRHFHHLCSAITVILLWAGATRAHATSYYWDPDYTTAGLQFGSGTWSSGGSASTSMFASSTTGTTHIAWTNSTSNIIIFDGSTTGGASGLLTITLGNAIVTGTINESWQYSRNILITDGGSGYGITVATIAANNSNNVLTMDCALTGTNFTKTSGGYVVFSKNCSYSGTITITGITANNSGGTVQLGNGGAAGSLGTGDIYFTKAGTQSGASTLSIVRSDAYVLTNNVNYGDATNGSIISNVGKNSTNGTIYGTNKITLSGTQTINGTLTNQVTYNINTINNGSVNTNVDAEVSGKITGTGGVTKKGNGTLLISGLNNDYSGGTAIKEGRVIVSGNLGSGAVSVNWDGTNVYAALAGTGTIAGAVTITNGKLEAGDVSTSIYGTLTIQGTLALTGTSAIDIRLGSLSHENDSLVLSNVDLGTSTALNLSTSNYVEGNTYTLMSYSGSLSGTFSSITGLSGDYIINYGNGTDSAVTLSLVPEPTTWAYIVLGCGMVFRQLRVSRKRS